LKFKTVLEEAKDIHGHFSTIGLKEITTDKQKSKGIKAYLDTKASNDDRDVVYLYHSDGTYRREIRYKKERPGGFNSHQPSKNRPGGTARYQLNPTISKKDSWGFRTTAGRKPVEGHENQMKKSLSAIEHFRKN